VSTIWNQLQPTVFFLNWASEEKVANIALKLILMHLLKLPCGYIKNVHFPFGETCPCLVLHVVLLETFYCLVSSPTFTTDSCVWFVFFSRLLSILPLAITEQELSSCYCNTEQMYTLKIKGKNLPLWIRYYEYVIICYYQYLFTLTN